MTDLVLKHGLRFSDLYEREGLVRLDRAFVAHLAAADISSHNRLMTARGSPNAIEPSEKSKLLVDLAPNLEDFIGELFGIEPESRTQSRAKLAVRPPSLLRYGVSLPA
jgi:hypothetical protein